MGEVAAHALLRHEGVGRRGGDVGTARHIGDIVAHPIDQRLHQRAAVQIGEMAAHEAHEPVGLAIAARPDEGQHILGQAGQRAVRQGADIDRRALDRHRRAIGAQHPTRAGARPGAPPDAAAADLVGERPGIVDDVRLGEHALVGQGRGLDGEQHVGRAGEIIIENRFDREAHGGHPDWRVGRITPPPQHRRRAARTQALRARAHAKVGAEAWVEASQWNGRPGKECERKGSPHEPDSDARRRKRRSGPLEAGGRGARMPDSGREDAATGVRPERACAGNRPASPTTLRPPPVSRCPLAAIPAAQPRAAEQPRRSANARCQPNGATANVGSRRGPPRERNYGRSGCRSHPMRPPGCRPNHMRVWSERGSAHLTCALSAPPQTPPHAPRSAAPRAHPAQPHPAPTVKDPQRAGARRVFSVRDAPGGRGRKPRSG